MSGPGDDFFRRRAILPSLDLEVSTAVGEYFAIALSGVGGHPLRGDPAGIDPDERLLKSLRDR